MTDQGYITTEQKEEAQKTPVVFDRAEGIINAPHFVVRVTEELNDQFGERVVDTSGFKVITTLDFDKQLTAQRIVKELGEKFVKEADASNDALVALDPKTGQILALVGSRDFYNKEINGQFDVISNGRRQPGSSFKPFVFLAAFERGFTPNTVLYDVKTNFNLSGGRPFSPSNSNRKEYGLITMRSALQGSLNISAVKTMYLVGYNEMIDFAKRFGYTTFTGDYGLSLVLGGGEVNPLEHATAYATLANHGFYNKPVSILKIENGQGETLYEWRQPTPQQVITKDLTDTITHVLADNSARAYIFGTKNNLVLPDRPSAAKTGTTQNYQDAWTLGYTPSLVTGVWVGNTSNTPMKSGQGGEKLAGLIWNQFMRQATSGTPVEKFSPLPTSSFSSKPVLAGSDGGIKIKINSLNGKIAVSTTPPSLVTEQTYLPPHDILYYVNRLDPRGPAPTNPLDDPQFQNWETTLQDWVARQNATTTRIILSDPPSDYDAQDPALTPTLEVLSPLPNTTLSSRLIEISVKASAPRGINRIEYRIDGEVIGTTWGEVMNFSHYAKTIPPGSHILTVIALDDQANQTHQDIPFTLTAPFDAPSVSWFGGNVIRLSQSDFPRAMYLTPFRFQDIKIVEIYLTTPAGAKKLIYTFTPQDELFNGNLIFTWNHSPGVGESVLTAVSTDKQGNQQQADLRITVN
jgi:membrane peptidoglycan carboxypeptidase